jgi:putative phage-type endonuclease
MNAVLKTELSPLRVGRITGSRVGAILGLNPYSTRADVLREMVREHCGAEREFTGNAATLHGETCEPLALAAYEAMNGVMTHGGGECVVHRMYDFLAVTPDGLVGDDGMIECKAPYSGTYTHWRDKPYYEAQMRLQLACLGRSWCDFVVYRDGGIIVSRLDHDPFWLPRVLPTLRDFLSDYDAAISSAEASAPHVADREACMETSPEWDLACRAYAEAKRLAAEHEADAEHWRKQLITMTEATGCRSARGFGYLVTRSERAGSIAYAKAIKDLAPDADLSKYAGKPTTVFTVKECK